MLISLIYYKFILISNYIKEVLKIKNKGEGDNRRLAFILLNIIKEILYLII
jgi:hypothetical protein